MSDAEVCKQAVLAWGDDAQMDMAIEECSELITAILHYRRGRLHRDGVVEEIAGVELMCLQLKVMLNAYEDVDRARKRKVKRLKGRLGEKP